MWELAVATTEWAKGEADHTRQELVLPCPLALCSGQSSLRGRGWGNLDNFLCKPHLQEPEQATAPPDEGQAGLLHLKPAQL